MNPYKIGTHNNFVFSVLSDGSWHNVLDIMDAWRMGTKNMAIRSRVSDIRRDLFKKYQVDMIESRINSENGCADYRMRVELFKSGQLELMGVI